MIFRQLIDADTNTYTYLIGDPWSREAVLIDPVHDNLERDLQFLSELRLDLSYSLDTHVHADHITGAGMLRARTGCKVAVAKAGKTTGADLELADGDTIRFGLQAIEVRATPGHTASCLSFVLADRSCVFTGDALLVRGCGRTDFQEGDPRILYRSLRDKIFSLPDDTLIYPGHDYKGRTVTTVGEERNFNPRLAGRSEDEFAEIMDNLNLAYPRKIDVSLPANLKVGIIDDAAVKAAADSRTTQKWPIVRSATGAPHVSPVWVAENIGRLRIIDVRDHEEFIGPDGRIEGAELQPMGTYKSNSADWSRDDSLILVCRSGGRSDTAAMELEKSGFSRVASLEGGMLKWNSLGLPVQGHQQG